MKYLGIEPVRPKVAVFDFTGCEGCELQLANHEETLLAFLGALEIVRFREVSSAEGDDYDVALVEGCISRSDEVTRLRQIRKQAKVLVAMGSCACFGGVNAQKNAVDPETANRIVYGNHFRESQPARPMREWVDVDLEIPGCPVNKTEVERIVRHVALGVSYRPPSYPVCWECKQRFTVCTFELGQLCLGPITRGGCEAPCPAGGLACWGCRGPVPACNFESFLQMARDDKFPEAEIAERVNFFGGFEDLYEQD
jgi:sulfhydrogenase subunit delta